VYVNYYERFRHHGWARHVRDFWIWATIVITVVSGALYIRRAVSMYRDHRIAA
jgi:hypothetical protein